MMLTNVTPSAAPSAAQATQQSGVAAAAPDAAGAAAAGAADTTPAAPGAAASTADAAQPFAQWLVQQTDGAVPTPPLPATAPADAGARGAVSTPVAAAPAAPVKGGQDADDQDDAGQPAAPDGSAMLAAMAMPLMPLSQQQIAAALQAAAGTAPARKDDGAAAHGAAGAVAADAGPRAAFALPQLAALQAPAQGQAQPQAAVPNDAAATRAAVQSAVANDSGAVGNGGNGGTSSNASGGDGASDHGAPLAGTAPVAGAQVAGNAPAAPPAADTVKLAGPPTAWRQSLQEALGDRLHVQVGNNVQQATISIEPPQLGRIDIAIRHSGGALEVTISATNGEVLRQLQTVSDNLRSDLSQRQFGDVAVTVTAAPKNGAAPFGDPQQGGRGRQQERDGEADPGRALAEAGNPASRFSLAGRDA